MSGVIGWTRHTGDAGVMWSNGRGRSGEEEHVKCGDALKRRGEKAWSGLALRLDIPLGYAP